jgi:hypothetical protein
VDPRPPDHGRYDDNLKVRPPNTTWIVHLIQPKRHIVPLVDPRALVTILASNSPGSELTQPNLHG